MEKSKISNKDIAIQLGVNQQIVTDWKNGKSKSYTKYLYQLADILEVSVEYLKGETDIKEKIPKTGRINAENTFETIMMTITEEEAKLILAYRRHPELHAAIHRMLEVEEMVVKE